MLRVKDLGGNVVVVVLEKVQWLSVQTTVHTEYYVAKFPPSFISHEADTV